MNWKLASRLRELQYALVKGIQNAGVEGVEILTAPVVDFRTLEWRAPPIYPPYDIDGIYPTLSGIPGILQLRKDVEPSAMYAQVLQALRHNPTSVLHPHSGTLLAGAIFDVPDAVVPLLVSTPDLLEGEASDDAGALFAMEFAACLNSAGLGVLIRSDDDFYLTYEGLEIGVKAGRPVRYEDMWPFDMSGNMEIYLSNQRGVGHYTQTLDVLDRIRYWYESLDHMPEGLEALPDLLCILKALSEPKDLEVMHYKLLGLSPETKVVMERPKNTVAMNFEKLAQAEAVLLDWRFSDQNRIAVMAETLIPDVMSEGSFNSKIWDLHKPVKLLAPKDIKRIQRNLEKLKNGNQA